MKIQETFGKIVRKIRREREISQEDFARKCGLHRTHMGLIERGETNITIENIEKIAKGFDIKIKELF